MIDTVVFRIVDVKKYEITTLFLKRLLTAGLNGKLSQRAKDLKSNMVEKRTTFTNKTRNSYSSYCDMPSHVYDFYYNYDENRDFIEFNGSFAKAVFGTNIVLFLNHNVFQNPYSRAIDRKRQSDLAYNNLINFIIYLLTYVSGFDKDEILILLYKVVIVRYDLCVNQVFETKRDALRYIECLKKMKRKRSRDVSKDRVYDTTGVYYASSNYTVKIYHKGTEFEKHDKQEIIERAIFSESVVNMLQQYGDRMVRYEMEIKVKYLSQLYVEHFFRKNDVNFKELQWCSIIHKRKFFSMSKSEAIKYVDELKYPFINFNLKKSYTTKYQEFWKNLKYIKDPDMKYKNILSFGRTIRQNANMYQKFLNRTFDFGLRLTNDEMIYERSISDIDKDGNCFKASFSRELFLKTFDLFWEFVSDYDIKDSLVSFENSDTTEHLKRKFKENGMERRPVAPYIAMYNLLQQGLSYKEIRMKKIFAPATFSRYKRILSKINVNDKCVDTYHIRKKEPLKSYFDLVFYRSDVLFRSLININFFKFS